MHVHIHPFGAKQDSIAAKAARTENLSLSICIITCNEICEIKYRSKKVRFSSYLPDELQSIHIYSTQSDAEVDLEKMLGANRAGVGIQISICIAVRSRSLVWIYSIQQHDAPGVQLPEEQIQASVSPSTPPNTPSI